MADVIPPDTPATLVITGNAGAQAGYTNTLNVDINVADVTDPSGVQWFVSESSSAPLASDAGWSSTKPTSYTITTAGDGVKNIYVYAKDNANPANNVQTVGKLGSITFDDVAPTKSSESFPNLDTRGGGGSGTIGFGESIHQVTSISFKKSSDNSPAGGSINVASGLDTDTLGISYTAPNLTEDVYIEITVTDKAGNPQTIHTNSYTLF